MSFQYTYIPKNSHRHTGKMGYISYYGAVFFIVVSVFDTEAVKSSLDRSYEKGYEAFKGERWTECIKQFEDGLHLFKLHKAIHTHCRFKCKSDPYKTVIKEDIDDLKMYEKFINERNCLQSCIKFGFEDAQLDPEVSDSVWVYMLQRKPYLHLHMCYFQMYSLPKAASAAYTYLVANPDDATMKTTLQYYSQQPEVNIDEIVDFQSEDYAVLYDLGIKAYKKNNWEEAIANLEEVIKEYMTSENSCRMECERQPEQETSSEFIVTMSNNMASLLHCRQLCQDNLRQIGYDSGEEFLAELLNYLQVSYYRLERYSEAAKCVASYLALLPDDEDILRNKDILSPLTSDDNFEERSDITHFKMRDMYEKQLLNLYHKGNDVNYNYI